MSILVDKHSKEQAKDGAGVVLKKRVPIALSLAKLKILTAGLYLSCTWREYKRKRWQGVVWGVFYRKLGAAPGCEFFKDMALVGEQWRDHGSVWRPSLQLP